MKVQDLHWGQIEAYLATDDRVVLPLGCTEQHAFLSLATDSILAERVAVEAAAPVGTPVMPVLSYGITPLFAAYPGSPSVRLETYCAFLTDILDSLHGQGFRRFLIVNGHGGNSPARAAVDSWAEARAARVIFHNWWNAPRAWAAVQAIDPVASHAGWMENFPWTRLPDVAMPAAGKPMVDLARLKQSTPAGAREMLGDGSFGGLYQRSDEEMMRLWGVAVAETRELLESGW